MNYDVIVVGGGVAGLTAGAYLARAGAATLLLEKEATCGGLVRSFNRGGFTFDGGIRAMENSGILFPMLRQLGLEVPFVRSVVSLGIEDRLMHVKSTDCVGDYEALLSALYPQSQGEITEIAAQIRAIMRYLDIQYGIDNPVFMDLKEDRDYFIREVLPWMLRYATTIGKVNKLKVPVVDYLRRFTQNQSLIDIIAQHFFRGTPAFFALSYFSLYLDYYYPLGGTGTLITAFTDFIQAQGGTIRTGTRIVSVDPDQKRVTDADGRSYRYRELIWAADLKTLYADVGIDAVADARTREAIALRALELADKHGGDSILTVYLALDLPPDYISEHASGHFFYTPSRVGQSAAGPLPLGQGREQVGSWLRDFLQLTTYEIACPVLRDATLAPPGKTGLIVSVLFDYDLANEIANQGWYDEFKALCETAIVKTLDGSAFPGLKDAVLDKFSSTPLTMERMTGNTGGAITGWAFTNQPVPAERRLPRVASSVRTPIPDIYQVGQWTFSPSGFPTAILSGKLAVDQVLRALRRER